RAAVQNSGRAKDRYGSIATDEVEVTRSRMSASPLKADNLHTISASPLSADIETDPRGQLYIRFSTSGSSALAAAMSASPAVALPFLRVGRPRPYNALASLGSSLMALLKSATAFTLSPVLK